MLDVRLERLARRRPGHVWMLKDVKAQRAHIVGSVLAVDRLVCTIRSMCAHNSGRGSVLWPCGGRFGASRRGEHLYVTLYPFFRVSLVPRCARAEGKTRQKKQTTLTDVENKYIETAGEYLVVEVSVAPAWSLRCFAGCVAVLCFVCRTNPDLVFGGGKLCRCEMCVLCSDLGVQLPGGRRRCVGANARGVIRGAR